MNVPAGMRLAPRAELQRLRAASAVDVAELYDRADELASALEAIVDRRLELDDLAEHRLVALTVTAGQLRAALHALDAIAGLERDWSA